MNERANIIPPMTHELGRHWEQPDRASIEIDDTHALMTQRTFLALAEYSTTKPSGVYPGKMWRAEEIDRQTRRGTGRWFLRWYGIVPGDDTVCSNNQRELLVA